MIIVLAVIYVYKSSFADFNFLFCYCAQIKRFKTNQIVRTLYCSLIKLQIIAYYKKKRNTVLPLVDIACY